MTREDFRDLSPTARRAVLHLVSQLSNKFSGRIVFTCSEGGVKGIEENRLLSPSDLPASEGPG